MDRSKLDNLKDEELVAACQAGDTELETYIINRYHKIIMQSASVLFLSGGDREDLVQEGRMGLFDAIYSYDASKNSKFEAFAKICILRAQYNAIQASNRKKNMPLNSYVSLEPFGDGEESVELPLDARNNDPEEIYLSKVNATDMLDSIYRELSPFEREVLSYVLEGFSYRQIAKFLGKGPKSIDNAFQRIRTKVKKLMNEG